MRLWSLHPVYLDQKGLVAVWREALLARQVLQDKTTAYQNHPQLQRFKALADPVAAINVYLQEIYAEAQRRGYHFDPMKIIPTCSNPAIPVQQGQVIFEWEHLQQKLKLRASLVYLKNKEVLKITLHPLFFEIKGDIEPWERSARG